MNNKNHIYINCKCYWFEHHNKFDSMVTSAIFRTCPADRDAPKPSPTPNANLGLGPDTVLKCW